GDDAGECKECIIVMSRLRPRRQTCRPGTPQQWHLEDVAEDRLGALSKGALEVRECILAVTGGRTITRHNLMLSSPTCVPAWPIPATIQVPAAGCRRSTRSRPGGDASACLRCAWPRSDPPRASR